MGIITNKFRKGIGEGMSIHCRKCGGEITVHDSAGYYGDLEYRHQKCAVYGIPPLFYQKKYELSDPYPMGAEMFNVKLTQALNTVKMFGAEVRYHSGDTVVLIHPHYFAERLAKYGQMEAIETLGLLTATPLKQDIIDLLPPFYTPKYCPPGLFIDQSNSVVKMQKCKQLKLRRR